MDVGGNKLEEVLDNLYKNEIVFSIDGEEIDFIRTGVETLVQIIADLMWKDAFSAIQEETEHVLGDFSDFRISHNNKYAINDIIKVGSFYEQTKNEFPDQFDFIFVMCTFETDNFVDKGETAQGYVSKFHAKCREILSSRDIAFPSLDEKQQYVRFDKYIEHTGPTSKLRFIYRNGKKEVNIYVNFLAAFRVLVTNCDCEVLDKYDIPDFVEEIKRSGSFILIQGRTCYIETEIHFIKNILSAKHVKVYRLLKYLLNSSYNNQNVREKCGSEFWSLFAKTTPRLISSYHMKLALILHHYKCIDEDDVVIAPCLLELLEILCSKNCLDSAAELHALFLERPISLNGYRLELLQNMIASFKAMHHSKTAENTRKHELNVLQQPLLANHIEHDHVDNHEDKTKASDWMKCLSQYITQIVLISVCGTFAILTLYILSYRP